MSDYPATLEIAYPEHLSWAWCWSSGGCRRCGLCWNPLRPGETVRFQATAVPLEGAPAEPVIAADARTAVGR